MAKLKSQPAASSLFSAGNYLLRSVTSLIAPPRCVGCLQEMTWLCRSCQQRSFPHALSCIICERPNARGVTCAPCRQHTSLAGVVSAGSYRSPALQRGIHWLKFKRISEVAPYLAHFMLPRLSAVAALSQLKATAALVPIPLHPRREKERGFNQAHELAAALAQATAIPLVTALLRTRATYFQSHLPHELRSQNVADAFHLQEDVRRFRTLLLVDDVTTSGATLSAAAQALRAQTSAALWGVTVARG